MRTDMADKPQKFLLCFERTNARAGYVWSVKIGRRWIHAKEVSVHVPVVTVWRGSTADQPRAYLYGMGRLEASPIPGFMQIVP